MLGLLCAACTSIAVDLRTFEGTRWRVASIDGRDTPSPGDYHIAFEGGRVTGRFGCNGWGGPYGVEDEALVAGEITSTMMACAEPAASLERMGFMVLREPMRWTWDGGKRVTLGNGAGSLVLERRP